MRRRVMDDARSARSLGDLGRCQRVKGAIGDNDAFGKGAPRGDGTLISFLTHKPGYRITECRA